MLHCDRCGAVVDERECGRFVYIDRYNAERIVYDLCDKCADYIQEVITENNDD